MLFSDISGHQDAKDSLRRLVQSDRLPHAMMLLGPQGSGKLALAIAFARYLLCEDRGAEEGCGRCPNCIKTGKLIHPDLHFSFPTVGAKVTSNAFMEQWRRAMEENPYLELNEWLQLIGAENRQGNINKEECVRIIKKLSLKSFEGSHKLLIMWMPELLGKEGNRLLKLIEEPPERTVIMLVAEEQEQILNTILSRCQLVKVLPFTDEEVRAGLQQRFPNLGKEAQTIAYLADGNFTEALRLAVHKENNNAALFLEWMRKCYKGNAVELVKWVDHFAGFGRENQKYFLRYALHFLREYLLLKMTGAARVRLQKEELKTARNLTKVIGFDQAEALIRLFTECSHYVERNANPKILFLDASIRVHHILKRKKSEVA
jgi:DNA polymerase-3 subunit delta'